MVPGNHTKTINGRKVLFTIPPDYSEDPLSPVPIVLAFHGLGSKAEHMRDEAGWGLKAEEENFVLICPNGTGQLFKGWHAGTCCGDNSDNTTDIEFVHHLLSTVLSDYIPHVSDWLLTGMSNGGMFIHRLAYELNDFNITAIASVSGTLAIETGIAGQNNNPIPMQHTHGTMDSIVSYTDVGGFADCKSVEETINTWKSRNKTVNDAVDYTYPKIEVSDLTTVTKASYQPLNPADGALVEHIKIELGGHTWPGHESPDLNLPPDIVLGDYTRHIKAEHVIWEFFKRQITA